MLPSCLLLLTSAGSRGEAQSDVLVGLPASCASCDAAAEWRYAVFDPDSICPAGSGWLDVGFDDTAWNVGCGPVGYEVNLTICSPVTSGRWSIFARKEFSVSDPSLYHSLTLRARYDDGFVAYLNGTEVARRHADGIVPTDCKSPSSGSHESTSFEEFEVSATALVAGDNCLAIQVHNVSLSSSDLVLAAELLGNPPAPPEIVAGPYLQQVGREGVVAMWETAEPSTSRVSWGRASVAEKTVFDGTAVTIHEVAISGLLPRTRYAYRVESENDVGPTASAELSFVTAPEFDAAFRAIAYGDSRTRVSEHTAVVQSMLANRPDVLLHVGDMVDLGMQEAGWRTEFFDPAAPLLAGVPLWPTPGNHEYAGSGRFWYREFFSWPAETPSVKWYAVTQGCCRIVAIDSDTNHSSLDPGSPQLTWLEREVGSREYARAAWRIVFFHHPPFHSASSYNPQADKPSADIRAYVVPLLEADPPADIVFAGHVHFYERSVRRDSSGDPVTTYITTGAGGAPLHDFVSTPYEPHNAQNPWGEYGARVSEHVVVDVTAYSLRLSPTEKDGTVFDATTYDSSVPRIHARQWTRGTGGAVRAVAVDSQGGTYLVGSVAGAGLDAWIARLDRGGETVWEDAFDPGTGGADEARAAALGPDGGIVVAAASRSAAGDLDWLLLRYDRDGNLQAGWPLLAGGTGDDEPTAIAVASDGTLFATGTFSRATSGFRDLVTLAVPPAGGAVSWQQEDSSASGDSIPSGIALDEAGDVYVSGTRHTAASGDDGTLIRYLASNGQATAAVHDTGRDESFAGVACRGGVVYVAGTVDNGGEKDVRLVSFDASSLSERWSATWDGTQSVAGDDVACGIAVDDLDTVALGVTSQDGGGHDGIVVLRYRDDATGASLLGSGRYETTGGTADRAAAIAADGKGNVYVAGTTVSTGREDLRLVKFDANGVVVWSDGHVSPSGEDEPGSCLAVGPEGGVAAGGGGPGASAGVALLVNQAGEMHFALSAAPRRLKPFTAFLEGSLAEPASAYEAHLSFDASSVQFDAADLASATWAGCEFFDVDLLGPGHLRVAAVRAVETTVPPVASGEDISFLKLQFTSGDGVGESHLAFAAAQPPYFVNTAWVPQARHLAGEPLAFSIGDATYFVRGNVAASSVDPDQTTASVSISDAVYLLNFLFQEGPAPPCLEAGDAVDDGQLNLLDAVYILLWKFAAAADLPEPFLDFGTDEDGDALDCQNSQL